MLDSVHELSLSLSYLLLFLYIHYFLEFDIGNSTKNLDLSAQKMIVIYSGTVKKKKEEEEKRKKCEKPQEHRGNSTEFCPKEAGKTFID